MERCEMRYRIEVDFEFDLVHEIGEFDGITIIF